jgi:hypothetical protein
MNLLVIGRIDIFQILSLLFTEPYVFEFVVTHTNYRRIIFFTFIGPMSEITEGILQVLHVYFIVALLEFFCFYVVKYLNKNVVKIEITRFSNLCSYLTSRTYVL